LSSSRSTKAFFSAILEVQHQAAGAALELDQLAGRDAG
jgi:hypothetical protein